jgi:hypothetical protein
VSRRHALAALVLGLLLAGQALARDDRGDRHHGHGPTPVPAGVSVPAWEELSPAQQESLARLRADWDQLPASRRVRALEWVERKSRWEAMTPEEREKLRAGARNFRDLPPELREKMRTSMRAMRALPEDERRALRERWHAMSPEQRRAWLQEGGPAISPPPGGED